MTRLQDVNTTDVRSAIELGCRTMSSVFNADDNDIPFFGSYVRPQAELRFSAAHSEAHVPGRHLNALLNRDRGVRMSGMKTPAAGLSYPPSPCAQSDRVGGRCQFIAQYPLRFHASIR